MTTPDPALPEEAPFCAFCGGETPAMASVIYHGVVYHPACVARTTSAAAAAMAAPELAIQAAKDTPFGANPVSPLAEHSFKVR